MNMASHSSFRFNHLTRSKQRVSKHTHKPSLPLDFHDSHMYRNSWFNSRSGSGAIRVGACLPWTASRDSQCTSSARGPLCFLLWRPVPLRTFIQLKLPVKQPKRHSRDRKCEGTQTITELFGFPNMLCLRNLWRQPLSNICKCRDLLPLK